MQLAVITSLLAPAAPALAQTPLEVVGTLPCPVLIYPRMESLPTSQWLPLTSIDANSAPFGIASIDWTDEVFNALKARVRQCAVTAPAALAAKVPSMLAMLEMQQGAHRPFVEQARRQFEQKRRFDAAAAAQLQAIAALPSADDQIDRLARLGRDMTGASPATRDQIAATLAAAQSRRIAQAEAAEAARQAQQASQAQRAERQRSDEALAELQAIAGLSAAQDQLDRLSRLRAGAAGLPSLVVQQIDAATAGAQARLASQTAAKERQRRIQQAEQELKAAQLATEQEEAAAEQRRQTASLEQARTAAVTKEQQLEADQAKADEQRLAALAQQQALLQERRQQVTATGAPSTTLPEPTHSTSAAADQRAQARSAATPRDASLSLADFRRSADTAAITQATRIAAISRDQSLLDAGIYFPTIWGANRFLTLRQLLAEALTNRPADSQYSLSGFSGAAEDIALEVKQPGVPRAGIVFRREGSDLFLVALTANGQIIQLDSNQALASAMLGLIAFTGVPLESFPRLDELQPH